MTYKRKIKKSKNRMTYKRKIEKSYNKLSKVIKKMNPKYSEHLSEPWFSLISLGLKTVEGRLNKGRFQEMQIGDIIEWHNEDFKPRTFLTKIIGKTEYKTFEEYLTKEGLDKCLPGMKNLEEGLSVYYKYFSKEKESEFGVIAVKILKL